MRPWVLQNGGSCVLILVSFWMDLAHREDAEGRFLVCVSQAGICGGIIPHKYRSSTLVGIRHPEMALQAAFRTGSIFEACDYLLQTGDAYSAEEKHRAKAVGRIVLASVPQLVFANFSRMLGDGRCFSEFSLD